MEPDGRESFRRLLAILEDLSRRLFDVEEGISRIGAGSPSFSALQAQYQSSVHLLQQVHNAACEIAQRYGQ